MLKKKNLPRGTIRINNSLEGVSIEKWIQKAVKSGEPIEEGVPAVFPENPNEVDSNYNIKADKFAIAQASLDVVQKAKKAKSQGSVEAKPSEGGGDPPKEGGDPPKEGGE